MLSCGALGGQVDALKSALEDFGMLENDSKLMHLLVAK